MISEDIQLDYIYEGDVVIRTLIGGLIILVFESIIVSGFNTDANLFNWIILTFTPIIPLILIVGYIMDIYKYTKHNNKNPPEFKREKVKQYLKDGFSGTIIFFIHTFTVFIPLTYIIISLTSSVFSPDPHNNLTTFLFLMLVVVLISFIYVLLTVPASFGIYTYHNSIISALSPRKISQITFSKDYIIAFLIAIIVAILVVVLSAILYSTGGGLLDVFIKFIALIFTQRYFAVATDKQLKNNKTD